MVNLVAITHPIVVQVEFPLQCFSDFERGALFPECLIELVLALENANVIKEKVVFC